MNWRIIRLNQCRFYDILAELRRDREEQARKWDEQTQPWKGFTQEQTRKWDELNQHSDSDEVETLCGVNLIQREAQINRPANDLEAANGHD